jgi:hypothetical protein
LAISIIAGSATPSDARMIWKPSVNAIWLLAAVSVDASISADAFAAGGRSSRPRSSRPPR